MELGHHCEGSGYCSTLPDRRLARWGWWVGACPEKTLRDIRARRIFRSKLCCESVAIPGCWAPSNGTHGHGLVRSSTNTKPVIGLVVLVVLVKLVPSVRTSFVHRFGSICPVVLDPLCSSFWCNFGSVLCVGLVQLVPSVRTSFVMRFG